MSAWKKQKRLCKYNGDLVIQEMSPGEPPLVFFEGNLTREDLQRGVTYKSKPIKCESTDEDEIERIAYDWWIEKSGYPNDERGMS